ncbi:MAG: T9SS type A sorting domain-containing protein [Bacteroidales bacterium]|nr:T9SS type A sorting domain-containing protein [Bacteroidales bacterium]
MKTCFIISFVFFTSTIWAQQPVDSLKNNISSEAANAYYDKISSRLVVGPVFENENYRLELYDITGTSIQSVVVQPNGRMIEFNTWLKSGVYILIIRNPHFNLTRKFRVNS